MKVIELATRQPIDVNDSYGARLIEQGKAVAVPRKDKSEPAPEAETKSEGKRKKGDA